MEHTLTDKQILKEYSKLMHRRRMAKTTPEQRKAASEKGRLAGLEVRRANAAKRKAEEQK